MDKKTIKLSNILMDYKLDIIPLNEAENRILLLWNSSLHVKDKSTPTFEEWVKLDKKRIDIYETFLRGFAYVNLGHLYLKYKKEFNITLIV